MKPKEPDFVPRALGEHLRKRRLELGLSQGQGAKQLWVNPWTILNWEKSHTAPPYAAFPRILRWLGYDPCPAPKTLPERLAAKRRAMGWPIREAARKLGVDPGTWRDWERGGVILYRCHRALIGRLLGLPEAEFDRDMRARWNQSHK